MMRPQEHTFLFVDLAGFTALTEAHGDEQAADLAGDFCEQIRAIVDDYETDEVKAIGDALMLHSRSATSAIALAMRVVQDLARRHGFPQVRIGIHTGPAVERGGDWFGSTVNIAARVSGLSGPGEVLITAATREAAGDLPDVDFEPRGERTLKNVREPVAMFSVVASGGATAAGRPVDPVCRMALDPDRAPHRVKLDGAEYYFCSDACRRAFVESPTSFRAEG
jgi:adenylate cyclase